MFFAHRAYQMNDVKKYFRQLKIKLVFAHSSIHHGENNYFNKMYQTVTTLIIKTI